ncbi:hypothetical protein G5B47_15260 [Paenibacillus sp. 7124]|uniref:Uncharacterized protein n=2 Tax=Paenibacillus TaxID=44249 RepID=A0A6M1PK39_9BACL|nr:MULTISPECIES: hypothetical protein [Paenibacillus]AHV98794.1 hypothetical protein PSAB_19505 [Paenibacillus sabinae T27]NGM83779.1 hypothetical protein [Paenibacillus apii]NJJ41118.1 hypothetical protein [Paenibacillus apii]
MGHPIMKFQRSIFAKVFLGVILLIFNAAGIYFAGIKVAAVFLIPSIAALLAIIGNSYLVSNGTVTKYFFGYRLLEIDILEIDLIEFYSVKKFGTIEINIASPEEDEYRLHLKNGKTIKIPSNYTDGRVTIGSYICKKYKVKKKETRKIRYFYS